MSVKTIKACLIVISWAVSIKVFFLFGRLAEYLISKHHPQTDNMFVLLVLVGVLFSCLAFLIGIIATVTLLKKSNKASST